MNYNGQLISLTQSDGTYNINGDLNTIKVQGSDLRLCVTGHKNTIDVRDSKVKLELQGDRNKLNFQTSDITLSALGLDNTINSSPNSKVNIIKMNSVESLFEVPERQSGLYCEPRVEHLNPTYYAYPNVPIAKKPIVYSGSGRPQGQVKAKIYSPGKPKDEKEFLTIDDYADLADILVNKYPEIQNETETYAGSDGQGLYGREIQQPSQVAQPNGFPLQRINPDEFNRPLVCHICQQPIILRQQYTTTPCDHTFHAWCLSNWLARSKTCPICEFYVVSEP